MPNNNYSELFDKYSNNVYTNGFTFGFVMGSISTSVLFIILNKTNSRKIFFL
jgi:hypothetical protein